ncbi:MAG: serine/threonine-protein phosphatase, partial [Bacteroidaceae bacterium]|nr:serine/threonine-protein phosphatase [Bacteroidaceae bacterium]
FFVTLFVGVLDLHTGMLSYCNAGHDVPLLVGRDVGKLPGDSNIPIGLMADWEYTCQEVDIDAGTTIFLYTDGLNEAEDKDQKQFSEERMLTVANTLLEKRQYRPEEFIAHMSDAVHAFIGDAEQSDDLTMLAVQYQPY